MKLIAFALLGCLSLANAALYCKDESGNPVDWWISYKIPRIDAKEAKKATGTDVPEILTTGYSYAYFTGPSIAGKGAKPKIGWTLSEKLATDKKSLYAVTTEDLYKNPNAYTSYLYNDDPPGHAGESGSRAHAKGVLAMDKDTGIWIVHSVPNFMAAPDSKEGYEYPESGRLNGQTLLCISFKTKTEGQKIAEQLTYMGPNTYHLKITSDVEPMVPSMRVLESRKFPKEPQKVQDITTIKGNTFTSFSRSNKAGGDLYSELVAPQLGTDLYVETWRRGAGNPLESECKKNPQVMNVENVNLKFVAGPAKESTAWPYIKDHSKWAVATSKAKPYTCIGDINRMASQFKRGGGTVCFKDADTWQTARDSLAQIETCSAKKG